jgi:hypothetical protein
MTESFNIQNGWVNPFLYDWTKDYSDEDEPDVDYLNDHNDGC